MKYKQYVNWALVVCWMGLIWLFSSQDADSSDVQSGIIVEAIQSLTGSGETWLTFVTRKAAHFLLYLVLGILIYNALNAYSLRQRQTVLLSVAIALSYAITDEVHQLYSPGRSGEVRDVLIDTSAAAIGIGVSAIIQRNHNLRKSQK